MKAVLRIGIGLLAGLFVAANASGQPAQSPGVLLRPVRGLIEKDGKSWQPIEIILQNTDKPADAELSVDGAVTNQVKIEAGSQVTQLMLPAVEADKNAEVSVVIDGQTYKDAAVIHPVRKITIYVLPHSHHDLGYTALQPDVEKTQIDNLRRGIELARKTADYPEGARFVWNEEVLWGTDQYVRRLPQEDQDKLIDAVKKGWVSLNAMYGNTLTGLCREEELIQLFDESVRLSELTGVKIDTAMQSDVPGNCWGLTNALAQVGIKYYSEAPNFRSRVGDIQVAWRDKPFWWVSQSGKERILVWMPRGGYAIPIVIPNLDNQWVSQYQKGLDDDHYPYDISYIRYALDNAAPEPRVPEFVKEWNTKYTWPKFVISSTKTAFTAFDKKYGDKLPEFKGDLTPYWEDGAASSALETAINRNAADRVVQAETLFTMVGSNPFPLQADREAWRNVLLYSEHTWGAAGSVSDAESDMTLGQWKFKRAYAVEADKQSKELLEKALDARSGAATDGAVEVFNTTSWARSEVALIPKSLSGAGDRVTDQAGKPAASQRLSTGELAIFVKDLAPFSSTRFKISDGEAFAPEKPVKVDEASLSNDQIEASVDQKSGGIDELKKNGSDENYAKSGDGGALNDYLYMVGNKPDAAKGSGEPKISVLEKGPLVATLRVESAAPGCNKLTRDVGLVAGEDYLQLTNIVDKKRVAGTKSKSGSVSYGAPRSKESMNFAFPFNVDGGQIRLEMPYAVIRPEIDQIPGSCKDWMEVGRWADVSNDHSGVTLATLDAPLVEIGKLSTLLGMSEPVQLWRKHIEPTQKIFSWVMNNHWYTNYLAYQEGTIVFRYAMRPHGQYDRAEAERFGTGLTQPLIVAAARGDASNGKPLLRVEPASVMVTAFKPSDDGKAWIVRLFNASDKNEQAKLTWSTPPKSVSISDITQQPLSKAGDAIDIAGSDLVTLRVERP